MTDLYDYTPTGTYDLSVESISAEDHAAAFMHWFLIVLLCGGASVETVCSVPPKEKGK